MADKKIDPKNIVISIDGQTINPVEFAEADIVVSTGGDNSEQKRGIAGGSLPVIKYDKVDSLKFALFQDAPSSYRLEKYHSNTKSVSVLVRDLNTNRKWTTDQAIVKSFDDVTLTKGEGIAFTIECTNTFKLES